MPWLGRKVPAPPPPDPTRTTWSVTMTGTCCGGHKVSSTVQINAPMGSLGQRCTQGSCGACGADVHLTGFIG